MARAPHTTSPPLPPCTQFTEWRPRRSQAKHPSSNRRRTRPPPPPPPPPPRGPTPRRPSRSRQPISSVRARAHRGPLWGFMDPPGQAYQGAQSTAAKVDAVTCAGRAGG
ncbi:hypothetical protein PVAP13_4NG229711 [Panicum virgatum]|uniref:Uncharacterized protein n=1 Tax=Panicum virgatum TaxID=38727 RepID=A0A8T0TGI2_PANVG|nr:hypothetical protein PVAP13_4NG229711 [Panicum virgatum]